MFGLFGSAAFRDPQLGEFSRSRGAWRGTITLGSGESVPLALCGTRKEPDAAALVVARDLPRVFPSWRPAIAQALFEHAQPEAPEITSPDQVWPRASLVFVSVAPLGGVLTTELGYATGWDEEHTLGARFQSGELVELCGSVLSP